MLKKCPFCGEEATLKQKTSKGQLINEYRVGCNTKNCPGNHSKYHKKDEAIGLWNSRPDEIIGFFGDTLIAIVDGRPVIKSGVDIAATEKETGAIAPIQVL